MSGGSAALVDLEISDKVPFKEKDFSGQIKKATFMTLEAYILDIDRTYSKYIDIRINTKKVILDTREIIAYN